MKLRDQADMDRKLYERLLLEMRAAGVEILVETDKGAHARLLAEARVRQGFLQG